jgi:hypothetical protein
MKSSYVVGALIAAGVSCAAIAVQHIPSGPPIIVVGQGVEFGVMPTELAYLVTSGQRYVFTGVDRYNVFAQWDTAMECKAAWQNLKNNDCHDAETVSLYSAGWNSAMGTILRDGQCSATAYDRLASSLSALSYGNSVATFGGNHANMWLAGEIGSACPTSAAGVVAGRIAERQAVLNDLSSYFRICSALYYEAKEKGCVRSVPDILSAP